MRSLPPALPVCPARLGPTLLALALLVALPALLLACARSATPASPPSGGRTVLMEKSEDDAAAEEVEEAPAEAPSRQRRPPRLETAADDERVGRETAREVAAEMGFVQDEALQSYVNDLGQQIARGLGSSPFEYHFTVVDQSAPNAFALPGGHIYVSRGLLTLSSTEDELANVIGHEITHSARRHAAVLQEQQRRQSPFRMPYVRMADLASYSRDLERDADDGGQRLAARAGYDPEGMVGFLHALGDVERLRLGASRLPTFFDTHPGTTERVATSAKRASQIRWRRGKGIAGSREQYLRKLDGIVLGPNPAEGVFQGSRFLHPDLDFHLRFPAGWRLINTSRAVGAISPQGHAQVFMMAEPIRDRTPEQAAEELLGRDRERLGIRVHESRPIRIGGIDAWRVRATGSVGRDSVEALLTFIPYEGLMYRIVGVTPERVARDWLPLTRTTARSFRPLTEEERASVRVVRLRLVQAKPGESLVELSQRAGNAWDPTRTGVLNQVPSSTRFEGGEWVKIAREEAYTGGDARSMQGG